MTLTVTRTPQKLPNDYHEGNRTVQDRLDSRRLADRMGHRAIFNADDRAFVEQCCLFFVATADAQGHPDVSYKGGLPGFVRVTDEAAVAFPDYDGNGQYRSLGNILVNPHVGIVFMDFQHQRRLRMKGIATLHFEDPLLAEYPGALAIVRVQASEIFGNCARYIHKMELVEHSAYVPRADCVAPVPGWKNAHQDALPRRDPAVYGQLPPEAAES